MRWIFYVLIMGAALAAILKFLTDNWDTLIKAPLAFFITLIIGAVIGFIGSRLYYKRELSYQYRIQQTKESTIQELRTRLGEIEPNSIYKNLSHEQLQTRILNHIQVIREFIQETESNSQYQERQAINLDVLAPDRSDGEFPLLQEGHQYWLQFNNETLLLKDEIKKRLPPNRSCENCQYDLLCNMSYRDPFSIEEVRRIADDLERLANSLVINPSSDIFAQTVSS